MKLHLPKLLRNALLACISAVAGVATSTVGTATMTGAALAVALANQQAQAAGPSLGVPTGGNFYAGDYTFTFTLTDGCLSAQDTTDVLGLYWGDFSTGDKYSNGFVLNWNEGAITLSVGDGSMANVSWVVVDDVTVYEITENTTFTSSRGATFTTTLTMGQTYTITNVGASGTQTVTLSGADIESETVTYNGNMSGGNESTTMSSLGNAAYNIVTPNPNPDAAEWDINWGDEVLNQAPASLTSAAISESAVDGKGLSETGYLRDGKVAVNLTNNNLTSSSNLGSADYPMVIAGVAYDAPDTAGTTSTIEGGVWIKAEGGAYGMIVGGSQSGNWGTNKNTPSVVTTDTHIVLEDNPNDGADLYVRSVIGGNMGDSSVNSESTAAKFTGNSYVSIKSGNVGVSVVGASATLHGGASHFTGDTMVCVYTPLSNTTDAHYRAETYAVVGGMMSADTKSVTHVLNGSTSVLVDLSESASTSAFQKMIIGGNVVHGNSQLTGSTSVVIDGTNITGDDIEFSGKVVGGSYIRNATANTQIDTTDLVLKGGSFIGGVFGGYYDDSNSPDNNLTATVNEINVTLDGATVGTLVGGSSTSRNKEDQHITQGDVTVNLLSGSVNKVYAAGQQNYDTPIETVNTIVNVSDGINFTGEDALVSGEYHYTNTDAGDRDSTITGDRTLNFVGASREYTGVSFVGFNKLGVTKADTTATITAYSYAGEVSKSGAGALGLAGENTMTSLTVTEGALTLGAGARLTGDLILSDNTGLNTGDGTFTLAGALTLGTGLSITGDVASTGVITLMSGVTELNGVTLAGGSVAASTVFSSINGNTEISGYKLSLTNGVLTLVEGEPIIPAIALTWAPEDAATNHGTWKEGSIFNDEGDKYEAGGKYDVTFGEFTNTATPEKVQIVGELAPNSVTVDGGAGTYEFYTSGAQSGIVAAAEGIHIASGTAIFRAGTLAMTEEQTALSVAGTLALDAGAMVDQDKVNIVLNNGGTLRWLAGNTEDYSLNGGLAVSAGTVSLDIGANNVQLSGAVQGATSDTTINIIGTAGQTLSLSGGVFGDAGLRLNGVNLGLVAGQYGSSISNVADGYAESISIAAVPADQVNKETILTGDNSGFNGTATIGGGATLVLGSTNALGANMALTGTGNVAFSADQSETPVTHASLNTDDVYTGTTTVRNNAILNWGAATTARSGGIILDNGSTLVLNCGVDNAISDGLATAGLAKGGVTITSLTNDVGDIIPVQWNSTGKTYSGLTTISANTVVNATQPLSSGNGSNVLLADASSVLYLTPTLSNTSFEGHTVSGPGTVKLDATQVTAEGTNKAKTIYSGGSLLTNIFAVNSGTTLMMVGDGSILEIDANNGFVNNVAKIVITEGTRYNVGAECAKKDKLIQIAGDGASTATAGDLEASAISFTTSVNVFMNVELTDDATIYSDEDVNDAGLLGALDTNGHTLTKTGTGWLMIGNDGNKTATKTGTDLSGNLDIQAGSVRLILTDENGSSSWSGKVSMAGGTTLRKYQGVIDFAGGLSVAGEAVYYVDKAQKTTISGVVEGASDATLKLTAGANTAVELTNDNSFAGTWLVAGDWDLTAGHANALKYATVKLNHADAVLLVNTETANLAKLVGTDDTTWGTVSGSGKTLKITNTATDGVAYSGSFADGVNVTMAGGYQKIASANQRGTHTFTAEGGVLDMNGYSRAADATGEDSIVAAGGVVKNLTLGEGMTLSQTNAASTLAGALTLAGGNVVFDLGNENNAYQVSTKYACEAGTTLTITKATMMVFTPDALLGYIDASNADEKGNYKLMTGLTSIDGFANLKSNFSEESRAVHTFDVVNEDDGTKSLVLKVEGNAATLAWTGETTNAAGKKLWDFKETDNWDDGNDGTDDDLFYSDDKVTFGQVMGDADNNPDTPDVAIDQVVTVADSGVKIGTMTVTGGTYTFEGGAISSAEGMGDITITGGNVTFNNSITTDGDLTVSGGYVVLAAANSYKGESKFTGGTVTVGNAAALSTTKTTVGLDGQLGTLILNITDATANTISNEISHSYGYIYAQESATLQNLKLGETGTDKSLNAAEGKTLAATVTSDSIVGTLRVNNKQDDATGTVTLTADKDLSSIGDIVVERGTFNATFNGAVTNGRAVTVNGGTVDIEFAKGATVGAITGYGGSIDITVKGAATQTGALTSEGSITKVDFQGGVSGGQNVTVNGSTTTLSFGAESTVGNILVQNAAELSLGVSQDKAASVLNAGTVILASSSDADLTVTGGLTLKSANIASGSTAGTVKLVGSTLDYSGSNLGVNMIVDGASTLKSTNANGSTTVSSDKTITLAKKVDANGAAEAYEATFVGNWTLNPNAVVWEDGSLATMEVGDGDVANTTATVTLTESGTLKKLELINGSTLTAASTIDLTLGSGVINGAVTNINLTFTGEAGSTIGGGSEVGKVVVNDEDYEAIKGNTLILNSWLDPTTKAASVGDLDVVSGKVWIGKVCSALTIGSIELKGAKAIMDFNSQGGLKTAASADTTVTTTLYEGALANAGAWTGLVNVVDTVEGVDYIRTYDLGGISSNATVNIGSLNADAATGKYSRLTNVGSLKLAGRNTVTLIDAMETGESVFGTTGAVTLADGADLHIDINSVLAGLLTATDTTPAVSTFKLGGNLTALQNHDNVVFDTALSLFNLKADFGTDGLLTLTQYAPAGNIYQSTVKQGDSTDWNAGGKEVYDSAEGYSAILIDKDTEIDLTAEEPAAAQNGLGLVLNNLIGTAGSTLSITGDGNDLVTISNTVADAEYNSMAGSIAVTDADVQILHTESMGAAAPVVNTNSTYIVKGSLNLEGGELKLAAGKLQLDGTGNQILDGVTVADDGQAQLILNGTTTLGGSIDHAAAAGMLEATGVTLPAVAALATQPAHIQLGAASTTVLADGAMVESGMIIDGAAGSVVTVAEGASATISNGAELSGAALELAKGTTLTVDTTETSGKLSLTGADIDGTLASNGPADASITVTQALGGTSTYAGDMNGYTGDLVLKGAGMHKLADDASRADIIARGTNVTITPDADDVISLRSLEVDADSTLTMDAAIDGTTANKKVNTTEGVTLAGDMNLTANLSTVNEGGLVFTGGTVEVQDGASINLVVNSVSDRVANALISEGETSVTLAEDATGFADVVITSNDQRVNKYLRNAVVRVENGKLVLTGETVNGETADFHQQLAETENGQAGADLLDNAYGSSMKAINDAESDVKAVLNHLENLIVSGNTAGADETLAAVAGASSAVLGMAVSADVDRQLQAIRNRTTTMGVDQSVANEDMPYFNAWINAEGDFSELSESGTEGGYELSSWGGTVGFDFDITPTFTAGMALTAMYGDLTVNGADKSKGDMDTYYISAFARYAPSAWTHTFVGTVGMSDLSMKRTVNYGGGSYETEADTDGTSFGLMYEVGRVFALNEDGTACLQPVFNVAWRHTTISGYTEKSSGDAGVEVDEQTLDTVTFGLGARLQAVVGESIYNRTSILEARVLAKVDTGDTSCSTNTALAAYNNIDAEVNSAERGSVGIEAGAGLTIPVGDEGGSIFMDASVELRSDYTNVNGTVGYRVNF